MIQADYKEKSTGHFECCYIVAFAFAELDGCMWVMVSIV